MINSMKIISWNVNGVRACVKKGFLDYLKTDEPDVLLLQETKAHPDDFDVVVFAISQTLAGPLISPQELNISPQELCVCVHVSVCVSV